MADTAETADLDFDDGLWVFTGNVVVEAENTILYCEEAEIRFVDYQLTAATLRGAPARFEQTTEQPGELNSGEANSIFYTLEESTLRLVKNAQFSDGKNKVSGDKITYDLIGQRMNAGSGDSGPVKIIIDSPRRYKDSR